MFFTNSGCINGFYALGGGGLTMGIPTNGINGCSYGGEYQKLMATSRFSSS
jgi:hypothetical protein